MTTKTKNKPLRLGTRQAEWAEWAIDVMPDHWCTEDGAHARDGEVLPTDAMPWLDRESGLLYFRHCPAEVVDDLVYRLAEQAPDLAEQDGDDWRPPVRLGERILKTR